MPLIKLLSHAIPPSQFNTPTITYYAGKPETTVEAEVTGIRMRQPEERIHLIDEEEGHRYCYACGKYADAWLRSEDRWAAHPFKCR